MSGFLFANSPAKQVTAATTKAFKNLTNNGCIARPGEPCDTAVISRGVKHHSGDRCVARLSEP